MSMANAQLIAAAAAGKEGGGGSIKEKEGKRKTIKWAGSVKRKKKIKSEKRGGVFSCV